MHHLDVLADTASALPADDVVVDITITDSRGFIHHYGEIHTTTASARAAINALSLQQTTARVREPSADG